MVLSIPNFLVKGVAYLGMGYLSYNLYIICKQDVQIKKLEAIKEHSKQNGYEFVHNEEQRVVQEYADNHFGAKILERMRTQHLLEEQINYAITKKQELRDKMIKENSSAELEKIEEEISKMNELYQQVRSTQKLLKDQSLVKSNK